MRVKFRKSLVFVVGGNLFLKLILPLCYENDIWIEFDFFLLKRHVFDG